MTPYEEKVLINQINILTYHVLALTAKINHSNSMRNTGPAHTRKSIALGIQMQRTLQELIQTTQHLRISTHIPLGLEDELDK